MTHAEQDDDIMRATLRLPSSLWEYATITATKERTSLNALIIASLREYLKKINKLKTA